MLTRPLMRLRVAGGKLVPTYVDPSNSELLADAADLLDRVGTAIAGRWTRGELDAALDEGFGDRRDQKLIGGLKKVLLDRTEFAADDGVDAAAFRREVFLEARQRGPLARVAGPLGRPVAREVLAEVGARYGLDPERASDALYADLPDSHRVTGCRVPDPTWLLHRYNLALAQSVLLYASDVRVRVPDPSPVRMRQLLRWTRFHQLLADAAPRDGAVELRFDGPVSLFGQSTRYGAQLARFLPALMLLPGAWSLEATVHWPRPDVSRPFRLEAGRLVTHYADRGAWQTKAQEHFEARFADVDTGWSLAPGERLVPLGPDRLVYPDHTLSRGADRVDLLWVGFWRAERLLPLLDDIRRFAPRPLLVAVPKKLSVGAAAPPVDDAHLVWFNDVLPPKRVAEAAAALIG